MDLSKLTPADATVTLRGLERRYRGLFAGLGEDETPDDVGHRVAADGWSAVEHVVAAAWAIAAADRSLAAVLTSDVPSLPVTDLDPDRRPKPGPPTGTAHERLAELGMEATTLADRISRVPAGDWAREATVDGDPARRATALDIVRGAIDAGVTHLRAAQRVLDEVRRRPIEPQ
ncbi:MAG TPA: hypothetical protein VFZ68_12875 [Acidimicrobiales bacterium]